MPTALITGASSGLGYEFAKIHAATGGDLVLVARNIQQLHALKVSIEASQKVKVYTLEKDLSHPNAANEIYAYTQELHLRIDILINNAGFGYMDDFLVAPLQKDEDMIYVNMLALTQLTKLYLPQMVQQGNGRIMNVASTAAFQPGPTMAVYCATKAYVLHFSEAIANELGGTGVTVTAFCPGATATAFMTVAGMNESVLVKGKKLPSAAEVAREGYRSMMKGKQVSVYGLLNYLMVNSIRLTPRNLVLKVARMVLRKR
jgi:short-subunit dehydrogenase